MKKLKKCHENFISSSSKNTQVSFFLFFLINRDEKFCEMKIFTLVYLTFTLGYKNFTLGYKIFTLGYEVLSLGYEAFSLGHEALSLGYEALSLGSRVIRHPRILRSLDTLGY